MNGFTRRALKLQAKQFFGQTMKSCVVVSAILLLFTLAIEAVQIFTPGSAPFYLFLTDLKTYTAPTGAWNLGPETLSGMLRSFGLTELVDFAGMGGFMAGLRVDVLDLAYLFVLAYQQLPVALLFQGAVFLLSAPILMGCLAQLWGLLRRESLPVKNLLNWYLDLHLTGKAVVVQLVLALWAWGTRILCVAPGLYLSVLALQEVEPSLFVSLAPLISIGGMVLAYFLNTLFLPARYLLARSPELSCWRALRDSFPLLRGRRREFFLLRLSFLPWDIVSMATYRIADIFIFPYRELTSMLYFTSLERENLEAEGEI